MIQILQKKSNELGVLSSTLCMIHCIATPFLLVALPTFGGLFWWSWLDIFFLIISSIAVFRTFQQSTLRWIQISLTFSLVALYFFILNERFEGIEFPMDMVYFPALALVFLHLINRRHCRCEDGCCEDEQSATIESK